MPVASFTVCPGKSLARCVLQIFNHPLNHDKLEICVYKELGSMFVKHLCIRQYFFVCLSPFNSICVGFFFDRALILLCCYIREQGWSEAQAMFILGANMKMPMFLSGYRYYMSGRPGFTHRVRSWIRFLFLSLPQPPL